MRLWSRWRVPCTYPLFERVKLDIASAGGLVEETEYGADITLTAAFPAGGEDVFLERLRELSAGSLTAEKLGEVFSARPSGRGTLKKTDSRFSASVFFGLLRSGKSLVPPQDKRAFALVY